MAVGDYVIGTLVNTPTVLTFQPAATVTLLITGVAGIDGNVSYSNGTLTNGELFTANNNFSNIKIFINNTTFLRMPDSGKPRGFCGVQVA